MSPVVTVARGWIGTPYRHQASLKGAGCDCLGLLRGVWRELRGAEPQIVPPYDLDGRDDGLREALARHLLPVTMAAMMAGDVLLFRMAPQGPARHCGIAGERDGTPTLIHARQNRAVREEPLGAFWRTRLMHVFRLPG